MKYFRAIAKCRKNGELVAATRVEYLIKRKRDPMSGGWMYSIRQQYCDQYSFISVHQKTVRFSCNLDYDQAIIYAQKKDWIYPPKESDLVLMTECVF